MPRTIATTDTIAIIPAIVIPHENNAISAAATVIGTIAITITTTKTMITTTVPILYFCYY